MKASLLRIPFTLSVVWAVHMTTTPPQAPAKPHERVGPIGPEVSLLPVLLKAGSWTISLVETSVVCASLYPSNSLSRYIMAAFLHSSATPNGLRVTWMSVFAWILTLVGALGRQSCYRTMQEMFTFELSLRKDHRLVTSGLYSIVRHPSYIMAELALYGALTFYVMPGSWVTECSGLFRRSNNGLFLAVCWLVASVPSVFFLKSRLDKEDAMLKEHFGAEWEAWATRVPFRLFPGLY
ncbi:hypothetical protein CPB84DRAFT_1676281 [Gymnopilus junonius]|uniref:Protein-S-isoprenylcysteine O-methyltransferase n=1 Tax=Gymnopilus junonius TaxID=109634 RepID=A0A9P5NT37_GYMJU|nr:hypothetical protein CPB84DRAFT_1676281 [Gymnopilus junonius]